MIILGIDPGYDRMGWAVGRQQATHGFQLLDYGCVQTRHSSPIFQRYLTLMTELQAIITTYQPQVLAIESLFFSKNTSTALRVSEVRGVIISIGLQYKMQIAEHHPNQVKLAVAGSGSATKASMAKMIRLQCSIPAESIVDDAVDAIGLVVAQSATSALSLTGV